MRLNVPLFFSAQTSPARLCAIKSNPIRTMPGKHQVRHRNTPGPVVLVAHRLDRDSRGKGILLHLPNHAAYLDADVCDGLFVWRVVSIGWLSTIVRSSSPRRRWR